MMFLAEIIHQGPRGLIAQVLARMKKFFWLLLFFLVMGIVGGASSAGEKPLEFTPRNGFSGDSEGQGTLRLFLRKQHSFHVQSRGSEQDDGTFRLDQTVTFAGEAPQTRFWIISTTSHNHYSATLVMLLARSRGRQPGLCCHCDTR